MLCREARRRLNQYSWDGESIKADRDLIEHLNNCSSCSDLIVSDICLNKMLQQAKKTVPPTGPSFNSFREEISGMENNRTDSKFGRAVRIIFQPRLAVAYVIVVLAALAMVQVNVEETVGYEVAISGIDRNIAVNNQEMSSLLDALGMDPEKVTQLMNSIERKEIHLKVGDCEETCNLKISDIKTEGDARRVIKAIIELGCCEIKQMAPIRKNISTSLLKQATMKLFS